jgi:peptide/nickel transport system permease protein
MTDAAVAQPVRAAAGARASRLMRGLGAPATLALAAIVVAAVFAPAIAPFGEADIDPVNALDPPSLAHPMGTDMFGRDVASRVLYGARLSLFIGVAAASLGAMVGLAVGMTAGYFGRWVDRVAMGVIDTLLAFPGTLLAMVIVAMLGPSTANLILAVGVASVPGYARLVRSMTLSIREADYVLAARAIGVHPLVVMARHVFPNLRASLIVYATLSVASAILNAAGLGFLGLGSRPPTAEWGLMVADGRELLEVAWWISTFPGLAILVTTLVIYGFGDALNRALDPKRGAR